MAYVKVERKRPTDNDVISASSSVLFASYNGTTIAVCMALANIAVSAIDRLSTISFMYFEIVSFKF